MHRPVYLAAAVPALIKLGLHLYAIQAYGYFIDEFYYLACAARPDFGYVDHPPLAAWFLGLVVTIFGDSLIAIRLPVALAGAATVFLTGIIAARLYTHGEVGRPGATFAALLASVAALIAPIYLGINKFYSPNSYEILLWTTAVYVLLNIRQQDDAPAGKAGERRLRDWFALGVVLGLGLQNKHSFLFLGFGIAAGLLVTSARRTLKTPGPYLAAAVAGLIFLPHLLWQFAYGGPTLEFMANARAYKNYFDPVDFVTGQILEMHPLLLPLWLAGLAYFFFTRRGRPFRLFGWIYVALFALFMITGGKTYYLSPAYPVLLAGGACLLAGWLANTAPTLRISLQPLTITLMLLAGAVLAPLSLPLLSPERYIAYEQWLGLAPPKLEKNSGGKLPQHFSDMFGWQELAAGMQRAHAAVADNHDGDLLIFTVNYGQAGALEHHLPKDFPVPVLSAHNNYYYWGREFFAQHPEQEFTAALVSGYSAERLRKYFAEVRVVETVSCEYCREGRIHLKIHYATKPKQPMREIFEQARRFI